MASGELVHSKSLRGDADDRRRQAALHHGLVSRDRHFSLTILLTAIIAVALGQRRVMGEANLCFVTDERCYIFSFRLGKLRIGKK